MKVHWKGPSGGNVVNAGNCLASPDGSDTSISRNRRVIFQIRALGWARNFNGSTYTLEKSGPTKSTGSVDE